MNTEEADETTPLVGVENPQNVQDVYVPSPLYLTLIKVIVLVLVIIFVNGYLLLEGTIFQDYVLGKVLVKEILMIIYLTLAFLIIILHLARFKRGRNNFFDIEFDNYPILVVMILISIINLVFYSFSFIDIALQKTGIIEILATISEVIFLMASIPLVIVCVHYKVRPELLLLELKTKGTILLTIAGFVVIFIKRVSTKIKRDINFNPIPNKNNSLIFVHLKIMNAVSVLELFNIIYLLICIILLIDPIRNISKRYEDITLNYQHVPPRSSFISNISLVRYRLPTLFLAVSFLVTILVVFYLLFHISKSKHINNSLKEMIEVIFLSSNIVTYIIGIIYGIVYYVSEIKLWNPKDDLTIKKDQYFNILGSVFQILLSVIMIIGYIYHNDEEPQNSLFKVEICHSVFMALQVIVQAICINFIIYREVPKSCVINWKTILFPSAFLASINFGFLIITTIFSQNGIFYLHLKRNHQVLLITIKDVALPIGIINRLHGTTFFFNLCLKQWPIHN